MGDRFYNSGADLLGRVGWPPRPVAISLSKKMVTAVLDCAGLSYGRL